MQAAITLDASARTKLGKGGARELRRSGKVPVNLYSHGRDSVNLVLDENQLTRAYLKGAFQIKLVELKTDKQSYFAIPREVQLHPVSDRVEHADFQQVDDKTEIKVPVPVHVLNADKSVGIKRGGVLNIVRHEIELLCKVTNIPAYIEVDVAELNIGGSIHINDIQLPKGATPVIKRNFTLVTVAGRGGKDEDEDKPTAAATTVEGGAAAPAAGAPAAGGAAAAAAKPAGKK